MTPDEPKDDLQQVKEAWAAYKAGGLKALMELGKKRNEERRKEQEENLPQPKQEE
jgi:hypothetical protein